MESPVALLARSHTPPAAHTLPEETLRCGLKILSLIQTLLLLRETEAQKEDCFQLTGGIAGRRLSGHRLCSWNGASSCQEGLSPQPLLGEGATSSDIAVLFSWDGRPPEKLSVLILTPGDSGRSVEYLVFSLLSLSTLPASSPRHHHHR